MKKIDLGGLTLVEYMVIIAIILILVLMIFPPIMYTVSGPYTYVVKQNGQTYTGYSVHRNLLNQYDHSLILETEDGQVYLDPRNGPVDVKRIGEK